MKQEVTISEFARLMGVSVHQIRYFEEKGVLYPSYVDENQYRMYGIEEIYRLSHIMLLRKAGLSVQAIRDWSAQGTPDDMKQLLEQSVTRIEEEMHKLRTLSDLIVKVLDENEQYGLKIPSFQRVQRESFALASWFETDIETELNARMLSEQRHTLPELFEADIHYIYEGGSRVKLCSQAQDSAGDIVLQAGEYLSYRFSIQGEEGLEQHTAQFQSFADRNELMLTMPRILVEKSYLSLFTQESIHYELLARIDRDNSSFTEKEEKR